MFYFSEIARTISVHSVESEQIGTSKQLVPPRDDHPFVVFAIHGKSTDVKRDFPPADGIDRGPEITVGLLHHHLRATNRKGVEEIVLLYFRVLVVWGGNFLIMRPVVAGYHQALP